jgi:hypothetical protein
VLLAGRKQEEAMLGVTKVKTSKKSFEDGISRTFLRGWYIWAFREDYLSTRIPRIRLVTSFEVSIYER